MQHHGRVTAPAGLLLAVWIALSGAACNCTTHGAYSSDPEIDAVQNFGVVKEGVLYRGSTPDGLAMNQLRTSRYHVKTLVNLSMTNGNEEEIRGQDLQYFHFPIVPMFWFRIGCDDKQIHRFLEVVRDPKNWPVFVYDTRGATRVGEAVGAYEILDEHKPITDVERELYAHHYCEFFHPYIVSYLRELAGKSAAPAAPPGPEPATGPAAGPAEAPTSVGPTTTAPSTQSGP